MAAIDEVRAALEDLGLARLTASRSAHHHIDLAVERLHVALTELEAAEREAAEWERWAREQRPGL